MRNEFESFASGEMGFNRLGLEKYKRDFGQYCGISSNVINDSDTSDKKIDVFDRLLSDRIIYLGEQVSNYAANVIIAQLLYMNTVDSEKPITMYINSPGGYVDAGLGIYDTMQHVDAPVYTTCVAKAHSMGSLLLSSGSKGHRYAYKHSIIMVHELSGGTYGKYHDLEGQYNEAKIMNGYLTEILAENTGRSIKEIETACRSDNFMTAQEALDFGLIDKII